MKNISVMIRKELNQLFFSPIGYIIALVFLWVSAWFFFFFPPFFVIGRADMRGFFRLLPFLFSFLIPAITMRMYAEERRTGSIEILRTLPLRMWDVLLGKFFAVMIFLSLMLLPTIFFAFSVAIVGDLDWGPVFGGYLGALLLGGAFSAIGLLCSSSTKNQIISFILSVVVIWAFIIVDKTAILYSGVTARILKNLGAVYHFDNIAKGILDSRDILYFLSLAAVSLYSTVFHQQRRS